MKPTALALSLLFAGAAAVAQAADPAATAYDGDGLTTLAWETEAAPAGATTARTSDLAATTAQLVEPSNAAPERDARGIPVISAAAVAPAGWNGVPASAVGGPELDPATGQAAAPDSYPACTAAVTDRCVQTYERGRR
jgi:hypothetical protein